MSAVASRSTAAACSFALALALLHGHLGVRLGPAIAVAVLAAMATAAAIGSRPRAPGMYVPIMLAMTGVGLVAAVTTGLNGNVFSAVCALLASASSAMGALLGLRRGPHR